jgi:tetratricopeptide (TPR) repeat protein
MAIKGSLKEASLADVLQLLSLGRKTGCLSVSDRASFGRIYFDEGWITFASIVNRRDRLGDLLIKNGLITAEELAAAVAEQTGQSPARLGEILIARGSVTRQQVERYIRVQIEEAVYFLFTWNQGTFYFEPDDRPDPSETLVTINPEGLLLEGARRVDEWTLIEKKVSSPDLVFGLDLTHGNPAEAELTGNQRRLLPLIDGKRSVGELVEESGLPEFETGKALYGLIQAGFARQQGRKRERAEPTIRPGRLQEHCNLGIAFFRTSMLDEGEREFRRVLEIEPGHLDAQFYLSLISLHRRQARDAIGRLMKLVEAGGRWPSTFHNLALALEATGRIDQALMTVEEGLGSSPGYRPLLLARGVLLARLRRYAEACEAFDEYAGAPGARAVPPASFFSYSVVALAGSGRLSEARTRADEGLELHPRSAPLLANAAAVQDRLGALEQAEVLYRRAVDEDPDLLQARRGLADSLYRRGEYEEAGSTYAALLAGGAEGKADLHFRLGNIAYKGGDREAALRHWRETVAAEPGHSVARTNLELVEGVLAGKRA